MAGTATKLHVLDCGSMSCDLTWLLLKPGRSIRPRAERDKPVEWYPCTTHAVVVETPDATMLWDTSCPRDWEERWVPTGLHEFFPYDRVTEEQYLDQRLAQLGLGPENLDLRSDYEGLEFETVSGDTEFLPGVTLIEAPGHTPGTMALRVDLPDEGTMIFTSDAVYMGDSYGPPATPAAIVNDLSQWYASVEKLRGIAEQSNANVIFGHDAEQLWSLRRSPDGHYT